MIHKFKTKLLRKYQIIILVLMKIQDLTMKIRRIKLIRNVHKMIHVIINHMMKKKKINKKSRIILMIQTLTNIQKVNLKIVTEVHPNLKSKSIESKRKARN